MSDCRDIDSLITPYADGELPPSRCAEIDLHVSACPRCRARLMQEQGGRLAIRHCAADLAEMTLPPGLVTRCRATVCARDRHEARAVWWRAWMPLAAALLVVVVGIVVLTGRSNALLAAQLTADHLKCFAVFTPREATGRDARVAEQQLAEYGWRVRVPASSPAHDLQLLGVRRCMYAEGTLPHVMYTVHGRPVSLFSLAEGMRPAAVVDALGHESHIWQRGGRTFVLVAPRDAGPMTAVAEYLEQEAR